MMEHQTHGHLSSMDNDPEEYSRILDDYNQLHKSRRPSRRHSAGPVPSAKEVAKQKELVKAMEAAAGRSKSSRGVVKCATVNRPSHVSRSSNASRQTAKSPKQKKPENTEVVIGSSDMSSDSADRIIPANQQQEGSDVLKVRNRALIHENRRLQDVVLEYERRFGVRECDLLSMKETSTSHSTQDDDDLDGEDSVPKLKGKIRALKTKRKHEKLALIQMEKNIKTHASEIESLQRELNRTVTQLEQAEIERQADKQRISNHAASIDQLKSDVQKRDNELEVTLELLQSKTERIIQLEYDIETYKEKLQKAERRVEDLVMASGDRFDTNPTSLQSKELISAEAEIKSLRRQNMMLKLVVEELQEARYRRSDSDIDVDSVFLKLPLDVQQHIPFSVGLGALSFAGADDDQSAQTDMMSYDTNDVVIGGPMRSSQIRLLTRPER